MSFGFENDGELYQVPLYFSQLYNFVIGRLLFRTQDLSIVKKYCQTEWSKVVSDRVPIQDFVFAKEVKLGTYSTNGVPPPGVALSLAKMKQDPRAEPQYAERVPYVIAYGGPNARLVDSVMAPEDFVLNK